MSQVLLLFILIGSTLTIENGDNSTQALQCYALFEVKYFCNHHFHAWCWWEQVWALRWQSHKFDFIVMESNQIKSHLWIWPPWFRNFDFKLYKFPWNHSFFILLGVFKRWLLTYYLLPTTYLGYHLTLWSIHEISTFQPWARGNQHPPMHQLAILSIGCL